MTDLIHIEVSRGKRVITKTGFGPEKSLCLLMTRNNGKGVGLGDHVQSLPVIYDLIERGYSLTVYAHEFFRSLYERAGCEFHNELDLIPSNDLLPHYGAVYSMIEWSFDEHLATHGQSTVDHTSLFASYFGLKRPAAFDFRKALGASIDHTLRDLHTIVYAPQSSFSYRNLPKEEQIYHLLKKEYSEVIWMGVPELKERRNIKDFKTLVDVIYNADAVLTVDNGIMHLACALGVPMFGVFGGTGEDVLCEPYDFYLPDNTDKRKYFRAYPPSGECQLPCWWQEERGFRVAGKCQESADCMTAIEKNDMLMQFKNFHLNTRSN